MQGLKSCQLGNSSSEFRAFIFSPARWIVLVFFLPCKGLLTQTQDYTITVAEIIQVPKSFCAHVPCKFTTPMYYQTSSEPFYGYWFRIVKRQYYLIWTNIWVPGFLMDTNDLRQHPKETSFKLIGDPALGDCSFSVVNASPRDIGWYYFRIDKGEGFRFAFLSTHIESFTHPQIILTDLPKATILRPAQIIWGEQATFICEVGNVCFNNRVKLSWPQEPNNFSRNMWRRKHSVWVWTYGVNATFIPTLEDEGRGFTCLAKYPHKNRTIQNYMQLDIAYKPRLSATSRNAECWPNTKSLICTCSFHSWPPPQVQWKVDGKDLAENNHLGLLKVTSSAKWNEVNSMLNWTRSPTQGNNHTFTCIGANPLGKNSVNCLPQIFTKTGFTFTLVKLSEITAGSFFALAGLGIMIYFVTGFKKNAPVAVETNDSSTEPSSPND